MDSNQLLDLVRETTSRSGLTVPVQEASENWEEQEADLQHSDRVQRRASSTTCSDRYSDFAFVVVARNFLFIFGEI